MKWLLVIVLLQAAVSAARLPHRPASGTLKRRGGTTAAAIEPEDLSHQRSLKQDINLLNQAFALMDAKISSYSPCQGVDWEMLWSDEFNDGASAAVDPTKWSVQTGDGSQYGIPGWGNDEIQYYTERSSNVYVQDGKLILQAQRESGENLEWMYKKCLNECAYWCSMDEEKRVDIPGCIQTCSVPRCDDIKAKAVTSARIRTYGHLAVVPSEDYPSIRIEASVKLPRGVGLWPAFWMLPEQGSMSNCSGCGQYGKWPASGEIDIFEGANDMSNILGTIFYGGEGEVQQYSGGGGPASVDGFQTIALEWDYYDQTMRWYMNENQFHSAQSAAKLGSMGQTGGWYSKNGQGNAPFDAAFYLILNLAVGGKFPNADPAATLADLSLGAKRMEVDYVRVCGKPTTPPETPV